ncbi:putative GTPase [bacterium HR40]|nr:putative GTPase [bacterium HR40]
MTNTLPPPSRRLSLEDYLRGVRAGDRAILSRAITLLESRRADDRTLADALIAALLPYAGGAHRIGITGPPGVGKSTLLDTLGLRLLEQGHRLAILAVDPTSLRTGGSILGDKTRMANLAGRPEAFVRPSPSGGALGGVARSTRETILLCEAAGFDLVFVETVGVGQSEAMVAGMVDFFLVLALPGAGDELQGLKKGVLELADAIAVTKADGEGRSRAEQAARQLRDALALLTAGESGWRPPVLCVSGRTGEGLDDLWQTILRHRELGVSSSAFERRRREQRIAWFRQALEMRLERLLREDPAIARRLPQVEAAVAAGDVVPPVAAETLVRDFLRHLARRGAENESGSG